MSVSDFKFFSDNEKLFDYDIPFGAGWIWSTEESMTARYGSNYTINITQCYGIHPFLAQFPPLYIIPIKSITGPNGIVHNIVNDGTGWGFNIASDFITIVYFTLNETV